MKNTNTQENQEVQPQIYVACLSSYNSGILHGKWIIPSINEQELQDQINSILKTSKQPFAEEWAVHGYDNFHDLGEYPSMSDICKVQEAIEEHGYELVNAYLQYHNDTDSLDHFGDSYVGEYNSFQEYAEQYLMEMEYESFSAIPEHLQYYFDYEKYARNLENDYSVVDSGKHTVFIFSIY
jgi:antirestriction protein